MFQDLRCILKNAGIRVWITSIIMILVSYGVGLATFDYFNNKFWIKIDRMIEKRIDEMVDQNPVTVDIDFTSWN